MAIIQTLANTFNLTSITQKYDSTKEQSRKEHFQKLYDYYIGDRDDILAWMKKTMSTLFDNETLRKMIFIRRNITKKVINRTALAYKYAAERYLAEETANATYQELLASSDINVKAKQWNRCAKLFDTAYVAPMWFEDHIEYRLFAPHLISAKESPKNYLEPESVMYEVDLDGKQLKEFWSATEHYFLDSENNKVAPPDNPEMINPYGVLQFIPCRLRETEDHWGEGDTELVDICEGASIMLTSTYHNAIMQSHGVPVGVNLQLPKNEKIPMTPDRMIKTEGVKSGDVMPSLTFAQPQPAVEACLRLVDEMFRTAAIDRGLTSDSVSIDTTAQSGAAKKIDTLELLEQRQDDIEALRLFEKSLFLASVAVWNYHATKKIPDTSTFIIDFSEPEDDVEVSVDDEIKSNEFNYEHGLWTPVDELLNEDDGIDEARALQIIANNFKLKAQIEEMGGKSEPLKVDETNTGETTV